MGEEKDFYIVSFTYVQLSAIQFVAVFCEINYGRSGKVSV